MNFTKNTDKKYWQRRTKIIATVGPSTSGLEAIESLIQAGVDLVRINFSHGTHDQNKAIINLVRKTARKFGRIIGILVDVQGPKIRVSRFKESEIYLNTGDKFILDANLDKDSGTNKSVGIDYKELPDDVDSGDTLLLDDGRIVLSVDKVLEKKIYCTVETGGKLSKHKGINKIGGGLSTRALTEKDVEDIKFATTMNVDYVAISFPRNKEDILEAKTVINVCGGSVGVVAKIERTEALVNIDEILRVSDGVMVARGDLAVEIGEVEVPLAQKLIINRARELGKPVIVATQMMESMSYSKMPTRAEVSDVANAVFEHTDAVMLSAETATGIHPISVIQKISRVCITAEKNPSTQQSHHRLKSKFRYTDEAIAMASMYTANHVDTSAIISLTESGSTPLVMSRIKTNIPVYAMSRFRKTLNTMSLYRGVYPIYFNHNYQSGTQLNTRIIDTLRKYRIFSNNDKIILTKGDSQEKMGRTNTMKILYTKDDYK